MRKLLIALIAATVLTVGYTSQAQAKEPTLRPFEEKTALERNRHRRPHRRGRRGGNSFYFGFNSGGYRGPRHYYAPPPVYYAPPATTYYYAPAPVPQTYYYQPAPNACYGGTVIVR